MIYEKGTTYYRNHATYGIMVLPSTDTWEVYYTLPDYPWKFAFGLPKSTSLDYVFQLAESNFDLFSVDMFDEEE